MWIKNCLSGAAITAVLLASDPSAVGAPIWFDETHGGSGYSNFGALATDFQSFVRQTSGTITFDDLPAGTHLASDYVSQGVIFQNSAGGRYDGFSGVGAEGNAIIEDLTGYDGSYKPNGNNVYVKFDNNVSETPFTFTFAEPVRSVSAFVGMGVEGPVHTVQVTLYDANNAVIGTRTVQSSLWDDTTAHQNYETFFAVNADVANISRVEVLNLATTDYANALIIDDIGWRSASFHTTPEPVTLLLLGLGLIPALSRRSRTA